MAPARGSRGSRIARIRKSCRGASTRIPHERSCKYCAVVPTFTFPREGPLDATFMTLRAKLNMRCALVAYIVSGGLDESGETQRPLLWRAIRECDAIAGNSRHMSERVRRLGGKNVHTVYDGIDRRYYFTGRDHHPKASGSCLLVRSGRTNAWICWCAKTARFPDWEFRLAGTGEEEAAFPRARAGD